MCFLQGRGLDMVSTKRYKEPIWLEGEREKEEKKKFLMSHQNYTQHEIVKMKMKSHSRTLKSKRERYILCPVSFFWGLVVSCLPHAANTEKVLFSSRGSETAIVNDKRQVFKI
ncbi:hypothetical protein OUZ56_000360 [Daphnia magna]|uniref:Uncharacterized protein n=1 Tax=Daphnia magna TaxID=35525 RepID=A0ABR0A054_9CRUS|nr:hypothetical protein OUZ56_000360 [Daphnia magna]